MCFLIRFPSRSSLPLRLGLRARRAEGQHWGRAVLGWVEGGERAPPRRSHFIVMPAIKLAVSATVEATVCLSNYQGIPKQSQIENMTQNVDGGGHSTNYFLHSSVNFVGGSHERKSSGHAELLQCGGGRAETTEQCRSLKVRCKRDVAEQALSLCYTAGSVTTDCSPAPLLLYFCIFTPYSQILVHFYPLHLFFICPACVLLSFLSGFIACWSKSSPAWRLAVHPSPRQRLKH